MNDYSYELGDLGDVSLGALVLGGIVLAAAATYGTYYLGRKAGFTGPQTLLGMLVLGSVTSALRSKPSYVRSLPAQSSSAQPVAPLRGVSFSDAQLMDILGQGIV